MEVSATARWVRTTARKARLVAATVEGLPVNQALTILSFTPRAAAIEVAKVIRSAAANAEHNYNVDGADLRVLRVDIDGASIIKRFRPRAQGRAFSIFKRTTHLRAVVTDERSVLQRRRPATGVAAAPPRRRTAAAALPKPASRARVRSVDEPAGVEAGATETSGSTRRAAAPEPKATPKAKAKPAQTARPAKPPAAGEPAPRAKRSKAQAADAEAEE